jgi:hypothetical protein
MKNYLKTVAGIMVLTAGSISVEAADYADLGIEEMVRQRSQVRELAPDDRENYRTEMQSRMQSMSSDERALFREMNETGGQGDGGGQMNRYGQGSGSGNMHRYGQGSSNGSGNMYRYDQGESQGYGSGYGSRQGGGGNGGGRRGK